MTATRTATVEFTGTRPTIETITWGQRAIWTAIQRIKPNDAYFNFVRTLPLPATDVATVLSALGKIISRHEALHTRFTIVDGEPHQQVYDSGELPVEIIEGALAEATGERYNAIPFDYEQDWPLRIAMITQDGRPTVLVLCFCHLATDFTGALIVLADLATAITGAELPQNTATQPVDLARYQRSPAGRRAAKAAATYWERAYERIPASMFEQELAEPEQPRFHRAYLISPALSQAAELVGERLGTGSSAVLNAAFAVTISAMTGHQTCALLTITKNRFLTQTREMVSPLALEALLVVPLTDLTTFDEAIQATARAALPAYRYAQYDELDRDRIAQAASTRRGERVHPLCCLNDLRDEAPTTLPFADIPLPELATRSILDWAPPLDKVDCRFCLHVADANEAIAIRVTADSAYLPRQHMLAFLKTVDNLVITAANGPVPLANLWTTPDLSTTTQ